MTPLEQYHSTLNTLRVLKNEPKHFHTVEHVPMKSRAPMFGLTTINNDSWLIGDRAILSRRFSKPWPTDTLNLISTWTASDGGYYAITDAPVIPPSRPWKPGDGPALIHLAGGVGATIDDSGVAALTAKCVYSIGDVCIKMHHTIHCDSADEHITIEELSKHFPLPNRTFALPTVLYHARYDDRYFLITSKVPGETAAQLWWDFNNTTKDRYANLIAEACIKVATLTSNNLGTGIDGTISNRFGKLLTRKDMPNILANCDAVNISIQPPFCFFHDDIGPTNVVIDRQKGTVRIIDWQGALFVPREWIGINFARGLAMVQDPPIPENYQSNDYAQRVWRALQRRGFSNDGSVWLEWKSVDWQ
ncbi:hypothetical protein GGR51DRAFT_86218 [Nemania sp. FL0031]|nr:hypothetical protein GGR51DRAFT_86218 [Nemania sp. FL0031]